MNYPSLQTDRVTDILRIEDALGTVGLIFFGLSYISSTYTAALGAIAAVFLLTASTIVLARVGSKLR